MASPHNGDRIGSSEATFRADSFPLSDQFLSMTAPGRRPQYPHVHNTSDAHLPPHAAHKQTHPLKHAARDHAEAHKKVKKAHIDRSTEPVDSHPAKTRRESQQPKDNGAASKDELFKIGARDKDKGDSTGSSVEGQISMFGDGDGWAWRPMANGRTMNPNDASIIAIPNNPEKTPFHLGQQLKITVDGVSAYAIAQDTGSFWTKKYHERVGDVSPALARKLGMHGLAHATIEAVT